MFNIILFDIILIIGINASLSRLHRNLRLAPLIDITSDMSLIAEPVEAQDHIGNEIMSKQISISYIVNDFISKEFAVN